jgi:hypothetical protein
MTRASTSSLVMPGFMPGIHVFSSRKTWMAGPSPAMTMKGTAAHPRIHVFSFVHCLSVVMPAPVAGIHVLLI